MIKIYTDGSFKTDAAETVANDEICAGVGVVAQIYDDAYNEVEQEEYLAIRYTQEQLMSMIQNDECFFECFGELTSTLIECIGFIEGVTFFKKFTLNDDKAKCILYIDDIFMSRIFNWYRSAIKNNENIYENEHYGCYMCMMHKFLKGDISLLDRIEVEHIDAHKDNEYNNQADFLAAYNTNPYQRITKTLTRYTDLKSLPNKRTYFETLQHLLKNNFTL